MFESFRFLSAYHKSRDFYHPQDKFLMLGQSVGHVRKRLNEKGKAGGANIS
jgi:hypothetical protein